MPTDQKYIKEPQPFGNPFKLIIRPKNQSFQMDEVEDEAFNTKVLEKKKASRLASFANIYKQRMNKQIRAYIKYYRENRDMKKIDLKILNLRKKHEEEKILKTRREKEMRESRKNKQWISNTMDEEEVSMLGRRDFEPCEEGKKKFKNPLMFF